MLTHPERLPRTPSTLEQPGARGAPLHASPSQLVDTEACAAAQEGAFFALRRPSSHHGRLRGSRPFLQPRLPDVDETSAFTATALTAPTPVLATPALAAPTPAALTATALNASTHASTGRALTALADHVLA